MHGIMTDHQMSHDTVVPTPCPLTVSTVVCPLADKRSERLDNEICPVSPLWLILIIQYTQLSVQHVKFRVVLRTS